jgi:hypothetical protein
MFGQVLRVKIRKSERICRATVRLKKPGVIIYCAAVDGANQTDFRKSFQHLSHIHARKNITYFGG